MRNAHANDSSGHRAWSWSAFAWGLAEATVFFIVPDVLTTRYALQDFRRAITACFSALAGALIGGTIIWTMARQGAAAWLLDAFTLLPGISIRLIAQVGTELHEHGIIALFTGGVTGQPYKLFAAQAGLQNIPFLVFIGASIVARLVRFLLTTTLVWLAGTMARGWDLPRKLRLHFFGWALFYIIYFSTIR